MSDPERERFEQWWAAVHDEVWAIIDEGHEVGETTTLMMMTRRDTDAPRPHMFVGKNFEDIGTEIVMLDDAVSRLSTRTIDRSARARIVPVQNRSRQARRRARREAGR